MTDPDLPHLFRAIAALVFVLGMMGGVVLVLRKMGYMAQNAPGVKRRLKIVEILHLDSRRKLAIVQRDDKQHLLVLGPSGETLIESFPESGQDTPKETRTV